MYVVTSLRRRWGQGSIGMFLSSRSISGDQIHMGNIILLKTTHAKHFAYVLSMHPHKSLIK